METLKNNDTNPLAIMMYLGIFYSFKGETIGQSLYESMKIVDQFRIRPS